MVEMSGETNRGQGVKSRVQRWNIRELGKAKIQVFNDFEVAPLEVRRVQVTAYDKHGWVVASSVVEEDATATNEQMSAAVVRMQEAMLSQYDDD
jgi:hypothetical protein